MTIILVSNILLITGVSLLITSVDQSKSILSYKNEETLQLYVQSCLEESLFKVNTNRSYTGTINLTVGDIVCQADVSNDADPNYKNINLTGTRGEYNYLEIVTVDISGEKVVLVH